MPQVKSKQQNEVKYVTRSTIKERGWTDSLIAKHLKAPDLETKNPVYATASPMKLYDLSRVQRIERRESFLAGMKKAAPRRGNMTRKAIADRAYEALYNILHSKMPVPVALDWIQDISGIRRDAIVALTLVAIKRQADYDVICLLEKQYNRLIAELLRELKSLDAELDCELGPTWKGRRETHRAYLLLRAGPRCRAALEIVGLVLLGRFEEALAVTQQVHQEDEPFAVAAECLIGPALRASR